MLSLKTKSLTAPLKNTWCFSVCSPFRQKSHYETLGVSRGASQADIKSAFYKLSKKHHPDANVNDSTATAKFQEIVEAYEVLGSEDSRKRYDVGMDPADRSTVAKPGFRVPDDPKAAFYKSRLANKMNKPMAGKMYDFDQWTKEHYSHSIQTNRVMYGQTSTRQKGEPLRQTRAATSSHENKIALVLCTAICIAMAVNYVGDPDTPQSTKSK